MAEDVGPDEIGGLFKDPEFFIWVVKGRDGFFEGWSDLVSAAFEVDGVGGADLSGDLPSKKRGGAFLLIGFMALGGFVVQRGFVAEGRV